MRKSWKSLVLKARDVMADPDIRSEKKTGAMKKATGLVYDNRCKCQALFYIVR